MTFENAEWTVYCTNNPELCVPFNQLSEECDPSLPTEPFMWYDGLFLAVLLFHSALFSGLNLGLMSLDVIGLGIVEKSGNAIEANYARALRKIRKYGNFLLCTLLLGNTLVNALLAIVLARLSGGTIGAIVTTFAIVIFGEIIPQSICTRHGLAVGYYTRYIVIFFMVTLAAIAYPISWVLDNVMEEEIGSVYNRDELEQLLMAHSQEEHGSLAKDEILIAAGALKFSTIPVHEVMTPAAKIFTLDINSHLDNKTMGKIVEAGYSRVPVTENDEIITILLVKDLILLNPEDATPLRSILGESCCRDPYFAPPHITLDKMLNVFQKGLSHMAVVRDKKEVSLGQKQVFENIGIITLEDLMEALIQEDIQDETDDVNERRQFINNMGKYKSFHMTPGDEHTNISEKEIEAISQWLTANYPKLFGPSIFTKKLATFIRRSLPLNCIPPEDDQPDQYLWKRGDMVDYSFLILSDGPIEVISSAQEFSTEVGPWNLLGHQALDPDNTNGYITDFSIRLIRNRPVRILKLSRKIYRATLGLEDELLIERKVSFTADKKVTRKVSFADQKGDDIALTIINSLPDDDSIDDSAQPLRNTASIDSSSTSLLAAKIRASSRQIRSTSNK